MIDPTLLGNIAAHLRDDLIAEYLSLVRNYRESKWGPAEVDGGRLAEVAYTILHGHVTGSFAPKVEKPENFVQACNDIARAAPKGKFPGSVRVLVPRMLIALYGIRNDRDAGHVGVEVDSNHMDAAATLGLARWVVAELVRLFHQSDPAEATAAVEALTEREVPLVWEFAGRKRILDAKMAMKDKVLALLYSTAGPVKDATLAEWSDATHLGNFRRDVLAQLHRATRVHYDRTTGLVHLSPLGIEEVETRILDPKTALSGIGV